MAIDKKKVIDLLAASITPATIAQTLNCDPSYISQLLQDPVIMEAVVAKRVAKVTKVAETDDKVQDIRSVLVAQIAKVAPFTTKITELCMALNTIDKMASRLPSSNNTESDGTQAVVNLVMPKQMAVHFVVNNANQITEVEGRVLETMSANRVFEQLESPHDSTQLIGNRKVTENANIPRQITAADL